MSLIAQRRERREQGGGRLRPPALWKLVAALALVLLAIWYLSRFT